MQVKLQAQDRSKGSSSGTESNVQASADTIPLMQLDGTILHVLGYGNIFLNYTETVDGYTIVLNELGFYEFAKLSKTGDLAPSGIVARDPAHRTKKENKKLRKIPKHLRHQGEALDKINTRQKEFNEDIQRQDEP